MLYKKFSSNYSASRGALNEFWRTCGVLRDSFAADFCQPAYEKCVAEGVARGRINAPGFFDDQAVAKAYMLSLIHIEMCIRDRRGPDAQALHHRRTVQGWVSGRW